MEPDDVTQAASDAPLTDDPALERWLSELRSEQAARSRARVGALKAHAAEDATVVGVLADLLERGAQILVTTTTGRRHRGEVLIVGPDALVLRVGAQESLVTPISSVASVRMVGGDPVHGEGSVSTTSRFGRILAAAAQPGEWMRVAVGGEAFGGTVVGISSEVAVMRLDNGDVTYVNLAAVEEVSLLSGDR
jgi:hypothetical protein